MFTPAEQALSWKVAALRMLQEFRSFYKLPEAPIFSQHLLICVLAVQRFVQAGFFTGFVNLHRCEDIDHLQHAIRKNERP